MKERFHSIGLGAGPYPETYKTNDDYDEELQRCLEILGMALIVNFWRTAGRPDHIPLTRSRPIINQMKSLYYDLIDALNKDYEEAAQRKVENNE